MLPVTLLKIQASIHVHVHELYSAEYRCMIKVCVPCVGQRRVYMYMYYPGQKKEPSSRFAARSRRTLFHVWYMLDQAQSAQDKSRGQSRIAPCRPLIAPDRAWYHTWNSILLAANLDDGSFFVQGSRPGPGKFHITRLQCILLSVVCYAAQELQQAFRSGSPQNALHCLV